MTFKKFIISLPIAALAAVSTTNPQVIFQINEEAEDKPGNLATGIEQIDGDRTVSADMQIASEVLSELQTIEGSVDYCRDGLASAGIDGLVQEVGLDAEESCSVFLSIIETQPDRRGEKVAFFGLQLPDLVDTAPADELTEPAAIASAPPPDGEF
ncbi:MAG: hypothetical protein ACON4C_10775 [Henriciella sp.]|jgi:hypothetical protein